MRQTATNGVGKKSSVWSWCAWLLLIASAGVGGLSFFNGAGLNRYVSPEIASQIAGDQFLIALSAVLGACALVVAIKQRERGLPRKLLLAFGWILIGLLTLGFLMLFGGWCLGYLLDWCLTPIAPGSAAPAGGDT